MTITHTDALWLRSWAAEQGGGGGPGVSREAAAAHAGLFTDAALIGAAWPFNVTTGLGPELARAVHVWQVGTEKFAVLVSLGLHLGLCLGAEGLFTSAALIGAARPSSAVVGLGPHWMRGAHVVGGP